MTLSPTHRALFIGMLAVSNLNVFIAIAAGLQIGPIDFDWLVIPSALLVVLGVSEEVRAFSASKDP